jgi:hypothetical protein
VEPNPSGVSSVVGTSDQPSGAFVRMLYVEREVKGYAITASELRQVGSLNRIATLFFSLGSGAVGYALGIWWDVATTPADLVVQTVGLRYSRFALVQLWSVTRLPDTSHIPEKMRLPRSLVSLSRRECGLRSRLILSVQESNDFFHVPDVSR